MTIEPLLTPGIAMPVVDPKLSFTWVAVVHEVARETGVRVDTRLEPPGAGRNHYRIGLHLPDSAKVRLLLNASARLVACAQAADVDSVVSPFRPVPRGDLFLLAGLHVAEPEELEQPLTPEHSSALTAAERRDVAYHRPPRIGDVIFNWFD